MYSFAWDHQGFASRGRTPHCLSEMLLRKPHGVALVGWSSLQPLLSCCSCYPNGIFSIHAFALTASAHDATERLVFQVPLLCYQFPLSAIFLGAQLCEKAKAHDTDSPWSQQRLSVHSGNCFSLCGALESSSLPNHSNCPPGRNLNHCSKPYPCGDRRHRWFSKHQGKTDVRNKDPLHESPEFPSTTPYYPSSQSPSR